MFYRRHLVLAESRELTLATQTPLVSSSELLVTQRLISKGIWVKTDWASPKFTKVNNSTFVLNSTSRYLRLFFMVGFERLLYPDLPGLVPKLSVKLTILDYFTKYLIFSVNFPFWIA